MPLFNWTGNPWVDGGIAALLAWFKKANPSEITKEHLLEIKEELLSLYLSAGWKSSNFTIFVNYPTNNPSNKGREVQKLGEFFEIMLRNIEPLDVSGNCIACGRRKAIGNKTRQHVPLTGSGGMRNFFSHAIDGADYCEPCAFAIQCMPLICYACGGKMILVHSNSDKAMKYWARRCIENVEKQRALNKADGCFNEGYKNPVNALFHITHDLILNAEENWQDENAAIRILYFTNYIAKPASLDFYDLPSPVFRFLAYVRQHKKYKEWITIMKKGYKNIEGKTDDEYKNYSNSVFQALLASRSIVGYFITNKTKSVIGDWSLLKYYLKEVRQMNEPRIEAIQKLGDDIAEIIKTSSNGKKRLWQLESASNYASFRNVLLRLIKDRVAAKANSPLIAFDIYANHLFPEGATGWKETQDLLLFRLYETLHQWLVSEGIVIEEIEEAEEALTT